ncbi:vesicle-fusing ATPase-like, partial [Pempheris klunzingeri]|uniref:vesicle-fusing ATPase-like n=1 Tax=Pempheris klunzingeri TaxID=3127111 RepID=UPI00397FC6F0
MDRISSKNDSGGADFGIIIRNSQVIFKKASSASFTLIGTSKQINTESRQLLDPNWDFTQIGVGGLDHEFNIIFRRAFSSRIFPPEIVDELGLKHVRGILLYGPPGTGKTLLARQIGKMLNSREPKIINGPEVLNKFVGESEANIRKLFEDAEEEQRLKGVHSSLHLIIFDEIDAICKQRGQHNKGTAVHDTVVNQLLSKIDGVNQLNNILIIGMTNRKDLIDSALLRPGRFEIQLEIGLPDKDGRVQILSIHTDRLKKSKKLSQNVDLLSIADSTKNFSGAELEGLVRAATTTAMNRLVKLENGKVSTSNVGDNYENFMLFQDDFLHALKYDIKPAFGVNLDDEIHLNKYLSNGIVVWSNSVQNTLEKLDLMINQTRNGHLISPVSVLIEGDDGAGKTALGINLALKSKFPLVKLCSPDDMIGMNEYDKCNYITKLFSDLGKSNLSCVVIDNIERIVDYVAVGPRFSNSVLQTLFVLIKQKTEANKKLLIACTTSSLRVLDAMEFSKIFTTIIHVPNIETAEHMNFILNHYQLFTESEISDIVNGLRG